MGQSRLALAGREESEFKEAEIMPVIRTILYPTDFSEYAEIAIPYVVDFAKKFDAKVVLMHAIAPFHPAQFDTPVNLKALEEGFADEAKKRIDEVAGRLAKQEIEVRSVIESGTPFLEIIRSVREHDADMIMMGSHGTGVFRHLLLGSTAERVARKSPCPVMTIRDPNHQFVLP